MSRAVLSSGNRGEVQGPVAWEVVLVKLALPSGTLRVSNHHAPITWGGDTYVPGFIGDASGAQNLSENITGAATQSSISLNGVDPDLVAAAISDDLHWKRAQVWTAYLDYASGTLINDPIPTQDRRIGVPALGEGKNSATLTFTLDSVQAAIATGKAQVLANDADQHKRFPSDTAFHYTAANLDAVLIVAGKQGRVGGGKEDQNGPTHPGAPAPGSGGAFINIPTPNPQPVIPILPTVTT